MGSVGFVILFLVALGIISIVKSLTPFKCQSCSKDTNLNDKKEISCPVCKKDKDVCTECYDNTCDRVSKKGIWCCQDCYDKYHEKVKDFIVVKAQHVGKHKTIQKDENISHSRDYKDRNRGVEELKYRGVKKGYNALTELSFRRQSYTHGNGYIENFTIASGKFAKVEKRKQNGKR